MRRAREESQKRKSEQRRRKMIKEEKVRDSQKKEAPEAPGVGKGRKVAKRFVFPIFCGSGGSKSRLAKAAGAKPSGQMRDEQLHTVLARSTFPSQNVQSTPGSDPFWKLRCRKSARRGGAKHVSKSTCIKHTRSATLHLQLPVITTKFNYTTLRYTSYIKLQ